MCQISESLECPERVHGTTLSMTATAATIAATTKIRNKEWQY